MKLKRNIQKIFFTLSLLLGMFSVVEAASYTRLNVSDFNSTEEGSEVSVSFAKIEDTVGEVEVIVFDRERKNIFWAGKVPDWEESEESNRRVLDFKIPATEKEIGLFLEVQANVYDSFDRVIAQGSGKFKKNKGALVKSLQIEDFEYDDEIGAVSFLSFSPKEDETLRAEIRPESFTGQSNATYFLKSSQKNEDGSLQFQQIFPELNPGKYYLFLKSEEKGFETNWSPQMFIQKGDVLRVYGVRPDPAEMLSEEVQTLPLYIEGYVPPQKNYQIIGTVEQVDTSGKKIANKEEDIEQDLFFEYAERFVLEKQIGLLPETKKVLIDFEIISAVSGERSLKQQIVYNRGVATPVVIEEEQPEVPVVVEQPVVVQQPNVFQNLVLWQWAAFILGGILIALLSSLKKNGRYLKGLIIFLASTLVVASASAADIGGYTETITTPSSPLSLNPSPIGAAGFNTLPVQVLVDDNNPSSTTTLFERTDIVMTYVQISFKANGAGSYTNNAPLVDVEDVFLTESSIGVSGYDTLYADASLIGFPALPDGSYDAQIRINFDSGDWVETEYLNYFYVDKTAPVVSVVPSNTDAAAYKDFTVSCTGEFVTGCVTPSALSATIRSQGNFCDGSGDGTKLCDIDPLKRTFELCDAAGNCSAPTNPGGDFFYYDAFPPQMNGVELRDDGATPGTGVSGDGTAKKSDPTLDFEIKDEQDGELADVTGIPLAGPNADPNMCGDLNSAGLYRNYNSSGVPIEPPVNFLAVDNFSPLYFGPDGLGNGSDVCRQREVICSNGPGHRGVWDRSTVSPDFFRCYDEDAGTPTPSPSCDAGYSLDSGEGVCKKTCGEGYYDNAGTCSPIPQCDPTVVDRLTGVDGVWINDADAASSNDGMTYDENRNDATGAGACSWGCEEGYYVDDELNPTTCELFTPESIAGLQVWLDADDYNGNGTSPSDEATLATSWKDKSGNNNDYTLVSGPTFESTGILGKPSVEILSGGFNAPAGAAIPGNGEFTTYYVAQKLASDSNGRLVEGHSGNWLLGHWSTYTRSLYLSNSPAQHARGPATTSNITDPYMFGLIREADGSWNFRDQTGALSGTSSSNSPAGIRWDINQGYYSGESSDSYFGEFIQYNRALNDTERGIVEDYLKEKWDLWTDEDIVRRDAETILAGLDLYRAENTGRYPRENQSGYNQSQQWNMPNCSGNQNTGSNNSDPTGIYDRPNGIRLSVANGWANSAGKTLSDYITIPQDPWGQDYIIDSVYNCSGNSSPGCLERTNGSWVWAIHSGGANQSNPNAYDADNIVYLVCDHAN